MRECRCGCGREARTPSGWAGRGCSLRAIPPDVRAARGRAADRAAQIQHGQTGGRARRRVCWQALLERVLADDSLYDNPRAVLAEVYRVGYLNGYNRAWSRKLR